jgi:toxin YoeB
MAQRKVIWSPRAQIRLYDILEYFAQRNKSRSYSAKLYRTFTKELAFVSKQPDIGIRTELDDIRGLIVGDYILFYETTPTQIIVHTLWDCRQDPNSLKIK